MTGPVNEKRKTSATSPALGQNCTNNGTGNLMKYSWGKQYGLGNKFNDKEYFM